MKELTERRVTKMEERWKRMRGRGGRLKVSQEGKNPMYRTPK